MKLFWEGLKDSAVSLVFHPFKWNLGCRYERYDDAVGGRDLQLSCGPFTLYAMLGV